MPCDVSRDPLKQLALHACIERSVEASPAPNASLVWKPTLALIYPKY